KYSQTSAFTTTATPNPSCTTHLVGYRKDAYKLNNIICEQITVADEDFLIYEAKDSIDSESIELEFSEKQFKTKTNLPAVVRLQPGARLMFLNNSLFLKESAMAPLV